jgi:hypothetical protein
MLQSNSQRASRRRPERSRVSTSGPGAAPVATGSGPATSAAPPPQVLSAPPVVPSTAPQPLPTPPRTRNSASPEPRRATNPLPQGAATRPTHIPASRMLRRQYACAIPVGRMLVRQNAFMEPNDDGGELERRAGILPSDSGVERFQKMLDLECATVRRAKAEAFAGKKRSRAEADEDEKPVVRDHPTRRSGAPAPSPPPPSNPVADSAPLVPISSGATIPAPGGAESSRSPKKRRLSSADIKKGSVSGSRRGDRDSERKKRKL